MTTYDGAPRLEDGGRVKESGTCFGLSEWGNGSDKLVPIQMQENAQMVAWIKCDDKKGQKKRNT